MIVRKERYQALAPNRFVLMEWGNRYIGYCLIQGVPSITFGEA